MLSKLDIRRWVAPRYLWLALFAVLHALIFLVLFRGGLYRSWDEPDISIPFLYGSQMALGQLPYRDFAVEYPPVALLFMLLPRLLSPLAWSYVFYFSLEILLFDLLALVLLTGLAERLGLTPWKVLAVYTLALLAVGPIVINRYDLIPAAMVLLALAAFIGGHSKTAYALLAVGCLTKLYPAVLLPLFLIYDLSYRRYRRAVRGALVFAMTAGLIALPFLMLSPGGFLGSFTYHAQRGLQIESTLAPLLLLGQKLGLAVSIEHSFGSSNIVSPLADFLARVAPLIMLAALGLVYFGYYRRQRALARREAGSALAEGEAACLVKFTLLAVLAFMLSDKVFSPQFLIWLLPLLPLLTGPGRRLSWLLFVAAGLLTYLIFPTGYLSLEQGDVRMILILCVRNLALLGLACVMLRSGNEVSPAAQAVSPAPG